MKKSQIDRSDTYKREWGTTSLTNVYKNDTPGETPVEDNIQENTLKTFSDFLEGCSLIEEEIHELIEEEFLISGDELYEDWGEPLEEAEKGGRRVSLGKPFLTPGGPKKRAVYVKNEKGNVVKVNFGDPNMRIKKNIPARRRSFRARHNCDNPGPRTKARYWSCKAW